MKDCKCNCIESIKESSAAVILFGICGFLLGIMFGFLASPVKKGINIGSNNTVNKYENDELEGYGFDDDDDQNC